MTRTTLIWTGLAHHALFGVGAAMNLGREFLRAPIAGLRRHVGQRQVDAVDAIGTERARKALCCVGGAVGVVEVKLGDAHAFEFGRVACRPVRGSPSRAGLALGATGLALADPIRVLRTRLAP